jgi:hypothetical protein
MLTYFAFAITALFPLHFVYRAWTARFDTVADWGLNAANGSVILALVVVIGRGDLVGGSLRYALYALYALALLGSWTRVSGKPGFEKGWPSLSWGAIGDTLAVLAVLGWALLGFWPDRSPADLTFPLQGEDYYVLHGGGTAPINYHGMFASSQRYALDIVQLNEWGVRATGLYPGRLSAYEIYGAPVYSPLTGTVIDTTSSLPDLPPGKRQPERPTGNCIWLRRDSLHVVLAHLKEGSVQVAPGDRVQAGERLAAVGNTGNTSEPHLHIHAVTLPQGSTPTGGDTFPQESAPGGAPDSLLGRGTPVPLRFDGQFLTRNDQFTQRRLPDPDRGTRAAAPVPSGK